MAALVPQEIVLGHLSLPGLASCVPFIPWGKGEEEVAASGHLEPPLQSWSLGSPLFCTARYSLPPPFL